MEHYGAYLTEHGYRVLRQYSRKAGKQIDLLQRPDGSKFVCRVYDHPVPAYEALLDLQTEVLPRVYRCQRLGSGTLVEEEFVDGLALSQILVGCRMETEQVCAVVRAVCEALQILHRNGLIHRDVKPENILLTSAGRVVLLDLDAASRKTDQGDRDTQLLGTVGYAAPEQFGFGRSDARTDIFSLGVLMNVMLTGWHPSRRLAEGPLRPVIETCVQMNVDRRYPSVAVLLKQLPEYGQGQICPACGFVTPGGGCMYCGTKPGNRKRRKWLLPVLCGMAALAAAVCFLLPTGTEPEQPQLPVAQEEALPKVEAEILVPEIVEEPEPELEIYPMTRMEQLPEDLYEPENHMAAIRYDGETYYMTATLWMGENSPPHANHHLGFWEDNEHRFDMGIGFWTQPEPENWVPVDPEQSRLLAERFDTLELKLYALDAQTDEILAAEPGEGCWWYEAVQLVFDGDCEGRWFLAAEGTLDGTFVQTLTLVERERLQVRQFAPDLTQETDAVTQINQWLAEQPPAGREEIVMVRLPEGILEGVIRIPETLQEVWISGERRNDICATVLRGGIVNETGSVEVWDVAFEGCGREQLVREDGSPNMALFGKGGAQYFHCSFADFAVAVSCTDRLRYGGSASEFRNNGIGLLMDTPTNAGGNFDVNNCVFRANGTAVEFRRISPDLPASFYTITDCRFEDNGMDLINGTVYTMRFPGLECYQNGQPEARLENVEQDV